MTAETTDTARTTETPELTDDELSLVVGGTADDPPVEQNGSNRRRVSTQPF